MIGYTKKNFGVISGIGVHGLSSGAFELISLFLFFENDFNIFLEIEQLVYRSFFTLSPWFVLFIIPALAMKSFAEETTNGTLHGFFFNH